MADNPLRKKGIEVGDTDPSTGQHIIYMVYSSRDFAVSIDKKLNLNWQTEDSYSAESYASDFGEIVGNCNMTDALVDRIFIGRKNRIAYKKMLGEVIGRILDDKESSSAKKLLGIVNKRIDEHCRERVRMAYIFASFFTVVIIGVMMLLLAMFGRQLAFIEINPDKYFILMGTFLGGVGAFITTFFRFTKYTGSVVAGLPIHRLDGFLRIFYGLIAGLIITLAIKGNIVAGFANTSIDSQPWLNYFLAMVAGASEILIPNLIKQTENTVHVRSDKDKAGVEDGENGKENSGNEDTTVNKAAVNIPDDDVKDKISK